MTFPKPPTRTSSFEDDIDWIADYVFTTITILLGVLIGAVAFSLDGWHSVIVYVVATVIWVPIYIWIRMKMVDKA